MIRVRGASSFAAGAAATGFWGGMTAGRLFLSLLTSRLGEFRSMLLYLGLAITFELTFWLIPNLVVTAVSVALLGVFLGMANQTSSSHLLSFLCPPFLALILQPVLTFPS